MTNTKNAQPLTIPMQSKLSLAEVDDLIHTVENPSFAEKNSITYQGIIRNAHITKGESFITTHGDPITKEQLYFSEWLEWKREYDSNIRFLKDAQNRLEKTIADLATANEDLVKENEILTNLTENEPPLTIENPEFKIWKGKEAAWLRENPEPGKETPEHAEWQVKYDAWLVDNPKPVETIDNPAHKEWQEKKTASEEKIATLTKNISELEAQKPIDEADVNREQETFNKWLAENPEPTDKESKTEKKIGASLTDKNGKVYKVPYEWVLKDSFQIKNYTSGKVISAAIYGLNMFVLYDDEGVFSLAVVDKETKELKTLYQLNNLDNIDPCIAGCIGSVYNSNKAPTLWLLTRQEKQTEDKYIHDIYEIELRSDTRIKKHTVVCYPLGHTMTATDVTGYGESKTVAFEDIDQDRRAFFRLKKGGELKYNKYFGTVAPSGIVTGEPIPIVYDRTDEDGHVGTVYPIETTRLSNGTIAWNVKKAVNTNGDTLALLLGYDANDTHLTTEWMSMSRNYDRWISANISVNDTPAPGASGPLAEPKNYFISNFADSKGVYYDWGQGWARTYSRVAYTARSQIDYFTICTVGATAVNTDWSPNWRKRLLRNESLKANRAATWDYTSGKLNERVYTVGGTNKGDESILDAVPFSVELLYQGEFDPDVDKKMGLLRAQVFGLVETSYSFKQTLITTPSEGTDDTKYMNLSWEKENHLVLYSNGEVYEMAKSSDVNDLRYTKIADYSFKLNVLDNKNLIKEDRDGNISLSRAFIPYNMDCVISVGNLTLDKPGADIKDPNDKWFEGIGYNVNLDVDEPSMSFLLPKIQLPLWISEANWDAFKTEAVDRRNSILKPVLNGAFLENETVDCYYTLQKDNQDCTYKSTNIMKFGKEAETAGWDISGKTTYDVLKKNMSWWMDEANTVIFPIGIGSTITGINFITPSAQLPQGYSSRLYTNNNRLFMGFNYTAQIWHGSTIFTIYGSNYYYDGQGIYFVGADQDFTNNNFVTYALGMKFLANSGSEAYFYSDFEKRLYVFTGSNTLQAADLLSSVKGTIVDALYSSKEQALYMLTSEGRILVRTQIDLCQLPVSVNKGHLEGTTEGAAMVDSYSYQIFSPWKGEDVLPFALRTEHFGSPDFISKLAYADILLYKNDDDTPNLTITCQTLNGIEKKSEKVHIRINKQNWRGNTYRLRFSPKLNLGNAFDLGIYSQDRIGVQSVCFYMESVTTGQGDPWQNNIVNEQHSLALKPIQPVEGGTKMTPSISAL